MAWLYLLAAGACEMVWPIGFKYTNGFKEHTWAIWGTLGVMLLSFWLMSRAIVLGMHVGTAYAIWTGVGASGTVIIGMILFNEPRDILRLACLGLIIVGVIGLKVVTPAAQPPASAGTVDVK